MDDEGAKIMMKSVKRTKWMMRGENEDEKCRRNEIDDEWVKMMMKSIEGTK